MTTKSMSTGSKGQSCSIFSRGSFFYLVESGQVKSEPNRKPRDGRYCLADIMAIKKKRATETKRKYKKRTVYSPVVLDWMYPKDLIAALRLDFLVYDEEQFADFATYRPWLEKNPHIAMAAYDASDREKCLAYIGMIPIADEKVIIDILSNKRSEDSLKAEEIERYDRPGGYTLLANSAVAHPDRPDLLYKVLFRFTQFWLEQYPERYIRKIYAQSVSAKGDMLIQRLFMAPRYDLDHNAYELDLARPAASKVIRRLKDGMMAKAPLPPELQWTVDC